MRSNIAVVHIFLSLICLCLPVILPAQTSRALDEMHRGDALRGKYRFEEAADAYVSASESFTDSLMTADDSLLMLDISDRLLMAENGISMMDFVYVPDVVAKHRFSIDDFFLYYPLPDASWRRTPCQLDSTDHAFSKAVYVPEDAGSIYWSATDKEGIRNIFHSAYQDTVWSAPSLLNEHMTSASDEIYPMLSPDGSSLYFSSAGLYGVGGYDLYVSEWDEEAGEWTVPVNMGFPYSSPADDFLFVSTSDGKYSVFASNRDCSRDSVWVYVLEYDDMPVRRAVADSEELRSIAALDPDSSGSEYPDEDAKADIPENVDTRRYMTKMSEVRVLRDSIDRLLLEGELDMIPSLQDSLSRASALLQEIEMEFLFNGVVIDPDRLLAEADREIAGQTADYAFERMNFGSSLSLEMLEPEPEFDYSFKILDVGQFAEDNTLPSGLVYQIQMFSTTSKADVSRLRGLSPVFEFRSANGRYTYRVGVFRTYSDVLANLNSVKRAGFRNAFITASNDGKDLTVSKARALEAEKKKSSLYEVRIETGNDDLDAGVSGGIRQQAPGKDIARVDNEDGTRTYVVGPFADRQTAENLAGFIRAMGTSGASCVEIPQK